jgi:hypothetical protein
MATTSAQVQQLYVGLLGRAADQTGLNYWLNELNATPAKMTLENLRANIVNSQPEYKAIFGSLSRVDTVTKIYSNLFGRAPDAAGLTYWTTGAGSTVNIDQLTVAFINGASTADTQALTNKAVVAEVYTSTVGANFVAADAASIIAGVKADPATVTSGIGKLTDGSLSGIAIPTGVSQLKAQEAAAKAQSDFQTAKVTELTKLSVDLTAAGQTIKAGNTDVTTVTPADSGTIGAKYDAMAAAIAIEINDARLLIGDGNGVAGSVVSTANLQINADAKAKTLADATTALKASDAGYIDKVTAYQAAVTTFSTAVDANGTAVAVAKGSVANLVVNATTVQKDALVKALNDSGLFGTPFTTADFAAGTVAASVETIYTAVSGTTATVNALAGVETALTAYGYSSLKPLVTQHKDYLAKQTAVSDAAASLKAVVVANDALEDAYISAVAPAATAAKAVVDSKAIDALAATLKAAVDGNAALSGAVAGITVGSNVVEFTAAGLDADAVGGISDVFHFGTTGITAAKDGIIVGAGSLGTVKGTDAIYVGNDYVKGAGTATAAGGITGGNDSAKEVFFFQKGNDTYVVLETKAYGSSTITNFSDVATPASTPDAAVIKLTGVGIEKVSFANGVVSVA